MSSSGGDGSRCHSSRLEKGKALVYASSFNTVDEFEAMEGPVERASRQVAEELQRHYDAGGEDKPSALGITIQELVQPFAVTSTLNLLRILLEEWHLGEHRLRKGVELMHGSIRHLRIIQSM